VRRAQPGAERAEERQRRILAQRARRTQRTTTARMFKGRNLITRGGLVQASTRQTGQVVLVTGATGFAGGHLCRRLSARGDQVRALARRTSDTSGLEALGVEVAFADVTDEKAVEKALEGVDTVYHLAAAFRRQSLPAWVYREVNVGGTLNMLRAATQQGVRRFVHCSTVGVHGILLSVPADESAPQKPVDTYQQTKCEAERLVLQHFADTGLAVVVVRPAGLYGPGDTRFLKLFRQIQRRRFVMLGSGEVLYHLTYIDDFVDGLQLCAEKAQAVGQAYIIAGEEAVTVNELMVTIARALQVPAPKWRLPVTPLWIAGLLCEMALKPLGIEPPLYRRRVDFFRHHRAFDISKARRDLGYMPRTDLETGVRKTAQWYKEHGWLC